MPGFCYIVIDIVIYFLLALQFAMLMRVIMAWIPGADDNLITDFFYTITEPVVVPVRMLFDKLHLFEDSPYDAPFFVSGIFIMILLFIFMSI